VCSLVVYLYCRFLGAGFVIDHHSASFSRVWDWALPIQKKLARRAMINIVTNQYWEKIIRSWNANALIMGDAILDLPNGTPYPVSDKFNIVFISTFSPDEPIEEVLEAVDKTPDVHVYITGDSRNLDRGVLANKPGNVTFTGFLPENKYLGLLRSVDAIMVLTTRDHTLQLGGCEAVSVGQPLITSDWRFLQEFFHLGTIHVSNTSSSIRKGIVSIQNEKQKLKNEMKCLRVSGRQEWECQLSELRTLAKQVDRR
jgi:glycosyltransferase involved in cell wall biosynthesis